MRPLAVVVVAFLSFGLVAVAGEVEAGKLIGAWELTKVEGQATAPHWRIEFLKGGKLRMTSKRDGQEYKVEGTHALKKDRLTLSVVEGGKASATRTVTVKKLTGEVLVFVDNGTKMEFKRGK
jgi:uncharacterized protein (TIGR03066 family)